MLQTAQKRLANKKRKAVPKKPQPPDEWLICPDKETVVEFFWAWLGADCDPSFTPNGLPWDQQDQGFWKLIYYLLDLFRWAEKRAEMPTMAIKPVGALSMDQL